jgi:hypothetical protein
MIHAPLRLHGARVTHGIHGHNVYTYKTRVRYTGLNFKYREIGTRCLKRCPRIYNNNMWLFLLLLLRHYRDQSKVYTCV